MFCSFHPEENGLNNDAFQRIGHFEELFTAPRQLIPFFMSFMIILWDVLQPKQGPGSVQGIGWR